MLKYWKWCIALSALFFLRLAFGLWFSPIQPMEDEVQTTLLGLKYYATGAWPYYGNDILSAPGVPSHLIGQDPGPLLALLVGLPLKVWPSPLAPFILVNLLSMGGFCLLALYACKRLPRLSPWFVFPWILTAPWCVHYSTGMMNFSYSIAFACLFFVAFFESLPSLRLRWIPSNWANAFMGLSLSAWIQLHRTWILVLPFLFWTLFEQWRASRKGTSVAFFILGGLPLSALIMPTLLLPDYHLAGEAGHFSFGFNLQNLKSFFTILAQFFAMVSFEMPRFIGQHTVERFHFLWDHWLIVPGVYLWYFGFAQVFVLMGFLLWVRAGRPDWNKMRLFTAIAFLFTFGCLLFTGKSPDLNTYYELFPLIMLYSLYVWESWWGHPWGRRTLWLALAFALILQPALVLIRLPEKGSFYLKYGGAMAQAIEQKNDHLLGKRRPGCLY